MTASSMPIRTPATSAWRDGQIVWLDLGMMGVLSDSDGAMFTRYIEAVAQGDIEAVTDAVLAMGAYAQPPDRTRLFGDIEVPPDPLPADVPLHDQHRPCHAGIF